MTSSFELRAILKRLMAKNGFLKKDQSWVWGSDDLVWLVNLNKSPYRESYSLQLGVFPAQFSTDSEPVKANDCPIMIHLENLPLSASQNTWDRRFDDYRSVAIASLDLDAPMDGEQREQLLSSVIERLGSYIRSTRTISDLRARYAAGDLRSAFIKRDIKQLLVSE